MPRRSNASAAAGDDSSVANGVSIEDLGLPRTMVQRLAKGVLPPNTQIQKDALLAILKSTTVFISYLASHANENTLRGNKKTIQAQDVLDALAEIEFPAFSERLTAEHHKFSSIQNDKRNSYRKKVKEEKLAAAARFADEHTASAANSQLHEESMSAETNGANGVAVNGGRERGEGDEPSAAKRARLDEDEEMEDEEPEQGDDDVEEEEDNEEDEEDDVNEDEDEEDDGLGKLVEDPLETKEDVSDQSEGYDSD